MFITLLLLFEVWICGLASYLPTLPPAFLGVPDGPSRLVPSPSHSLPLSQPCADKTNKISLCRGRRPRAPTRLVIKATSHPREECPLEIILICFVNCKTL